MATQEIEYWPTEAWETSTPEAQGIDSARLSEAVRFLRDQDGFVPHALLVIRNGYVVADAAFHPFPSGAPHVTASVTKSITATLVAMTVNQGYIRGLDEPVLSFFPGREVANRDAAKESMTLEDLLTMRSGLECMYEGGEVTLSHMKSQPDYVQYALGLPMADPPGVRWAYCSPGVHILSAALQQATGRTALEFSQEVLFGPLGIRDVGWPLDPQGVCWGWGNARLTPYDMAKVGLLYLQGGIWEGQRLLPAWWVQRATSALTATNRRGLGYGYLWWVRPGGPNPYYLALGRGGQRVVVVPGKNLLIVTAGGGGPDQNRILDALVESHVLPAVQSDSALPANPQGQEMLETAIAHASSARREITRPVVPWPDEARAIAGQSFPLPANPFGWASVALSYKKPDEAALSMMFGDGEQVTWAVGLDGAYRYAPGRYGLLARAKGIWQADGSLAIVLDEIGNINRWEMLLMPRPGRLTIRCQESTGLGEMTLVGTA